MRIQSVTRDGKLLVALYLIFPLLSGAQIVKSLRFEGLHKTKENYVRQFLTTREGTVLDSAILYQDKQRLTNLEVFFDASFTTKQVENGYVVTFTCNELYTLLPIFNFGGIKENFWIQTGFSEVNFGGQGNKLTTYYQYYDLSSYVAHLTLDRIRHSNWGLNVNLIKWGTLEPLYFGGQQVEYKYRNYTAGVNGIRHFNFRDRAEIGGAYFAENFKKRTPGNFEEAPDKVNKRKLSGTITFVWNRVNSHFFYVSGWHNRLNLQTVQSLNREAPFYIFLNDLKNFKQVGEKGNFASRARIGLSTNEDTPFAPFVLDSYVNIRGIGNRVDRGTGTIIINVEYRHTLLGKRKTAVQGVLFSDIGSWRNPGGDLSDFILSGNFVLFAGGGFRFIHKEIYNAIIRIDYGFNLRAPEVNGFVFGIGQYF